jgi:hypothetical protein
MFPEQDVSKNKIKRYRNTDLNASRAKCAKEQNQMRQKLEDTDLNASGAKRVKI